MKQAFFGGGGVKVPDYRNKFEKNVFGDQRKINLLVDLFLQTVCPFFCNYMNYFRVKHATSDNGS